MSLKKSFKLVPLLFALFASYRCTPKLDGLYVDDSFTPDAIKNGKIVVVGATSAIGELDAGDADRISALVRNAFMAQESGYRVLPKSAAVNKLGKQDYAKIVSSYGDTELSDQELSLLKQKLGSTARYAVFVRLDQNETEKGRYETEQSSKTDDKGNKSFTPGKLVAFNNRVVTMTIHIFDINAKKSVFSGSRSQTTERSNMQEKAVIGKSLLGDVVSISNKFSGKEKLSDVPMPEAPSLKEAAIPIAEVFAKNLPTP